MSGLDFLLTSICFFVLGYGLCYITISCHSELHTRDEHIEDSSQILHK